MFKHHQDFEKYVNSLLPPRKRKSRTKQFLRAAINPLMELYLVFKSQVFQLYETLSFTGQNISMRLMLNKRFHNIDADIIKIADRDTLKNVYLFNSDEIGVQGHKSLVLHNYSEYIISGSGGTTNYNLADYSPYPKIVFIANQSEYANDNDFHIVVPNYNDYSIEEIESLVNIYKGADKHYSVIDMADLYAKYSVNGELKNIVLISKTDQYHGQINNN